MGRAKIWYVEGFDMKLALGGKFHSAKTSGRAAFHTAAAVGGDTPAVFEKETSQVPRAETKCEHMPTLCQIFRLTRVNAGSYPFRLSFGCGKALVWIPHCSGPSGDTDAQGSYNHATCPHSGSIDEAEVVRALLYNFGTTRTVLMGIYMGAATFDESIHSRNRGEVDWRSIFFVAANL